MEVARFCQRQLILVTAATLYASALYASAVYVIAGVYLSVRLSVTCR